MTGRARARLVGGVLCLAGAAAAISHAATGSLTVPAESSRTGAAVCAEDRVATVGGYSNDPGARWEILGLRPAGRRWKVSLYNGFPIEQSTTLHALCASADRYSVRRKRQEIEDGVFTSVVAKCRRGTTIAGGGFAPIPDAIPSVTENRPVGGRKWRVTVYVNEPAVATHVLRAYAVCDRRDGEHVTRTDTANPDPPRMIRGIAVPFDLEAECPAGSRLTGGGFSSGEELNERYEVVRPRRRSFQLAGQTFSSIPITAYARCLK